MRKVTLQDGRKGIFHQFGNTFIEDERGYTGFTIAIIELEDGQLIEQSYQNVKFDHPTKINV